MKQAQMDEHLRGCHNTTAQRQLACAHASGQSAGSIIGSLATPDIWGTIQTASPPALGKISSPAAHNVVGSVTRATVPVAPSAINSINTGATARLALRGRLFCGSFLWGAPRPLSALLRYDGWRRRSRGCFA